MGTLVVRETRGPQSFERNIEPRFPSVDTNQAHVVVPVPLGHSLTSGHLTCLLWVLHLCLSAYLSLSIFIVLYVVALACPGLHVKQLQWSARQSLSTKSCVTRWGRRH